MSPLKKSSGGLALGNDPRCRFLADEVDEPLWVGGDDLVDRTELIPKEVEGDVVVVVHGRDVYVVSATQCYAGEMTRERHRCDRADTHLSRIRGGKSSDGHYM